MKKLIKDSVIEFIRECIENSNDFSAHDFIPYLISDLNNKNLLSTLPKVKNENGKMEELDFENSEILKIDNDSITICAGGDWQDPLTFILKMNGDKVMCEIVGPGYSEGMKSTDFLYELFGVSMEEMGGIADDYGICVNFTSDFERKLSTFYREAKLGRILDEPKEDSHIEGVMTTAAAVGSVIEGVMTTADVTVEEPKVTLQELKDFDFESISSKEAADAFKDMILKADKNDIIRFINHMRYIQYHCDRGTGFINRIIKFMGYPELKEIEKESGLVFGETEEIVIPVDKTLSLIHI